MANEDLMAQIIRGMDRESSLKAETMKKEEQSSMNFEDLSKQLLNRRIVNDLQEVNIMELKSEIYRLQELLAKTPEG